MCGNEPLIEIKMRFLIHFLFLSVNIGHREISQLFLRIRNVWCRSDHRHSQPCLWPLCWSSWIWSRCDLTRFFTCFAKYFKIYVYLFCLFFSIGWRCGPYTFCQDPDHWDLWKRNRSIWPYHRSSFGKYRYI